MYSDIADNSNKTLYIKVDGVTLSSSWGRVGDSLQTKSWTFSSPSLAEKEYNKKIKAKIKKGYEQVEVAGINIDKPSNINLAQVAAQEIDVDSEDTRNLIKWLTSQNIHQICSNTTIQYNSTKGLFTTPIGVVVGQSTIDKARIKLTNISNILAASSYDNSLLISEANSYLKLIPQDLGRARDKLDINKIFVGDNKIAKQIDILDSLEASLLSLLTSPTSKDTMEEQAKTFECKLHRIKDSHLINEIDKLYQSSIKLTHLSSKCQLKDVYEVSIPSMQVAWENYGGKLTNIQRLWHGTRVSNVLSILKRGLVTPKQGVSVLNGSNYGVGTYFSNSSTKSLNYAVPGTWFTGNEKRYFMFLSDVALGKYHVPKSSNESLPKTGSDSTWARGGESGVMYDEIVIYRSDQCNLIYLCEFA